MLHETQPDGCLFQSAEGDKGITADRPGQRTQGHARLEPNKVRVQIGEAKSIFDIECRQDQFLQFEILST